MNLNWFEENKFFTIVLGFHNKSCRSRTETEKIRQNLKQDIQDENYYQLGFELAKSMLCFLNLFSLY